MGSLLPTKRSKLLHASDAVPAYIVTVVGHALWLCKSSALNAASRPSRAEERVQNMVNQMDEEGFGSCTNHGECEAVCPKDIV